MSPIAPALMLQVAEIAALTARRGRPVDAASLAYTWKVNGVTALTGTAATAGGFSFRPQTEGTYSVTLTVTDKDNASTTSAPAAVTPAAPVANPAVPAANETAPAVPLAQ